MTVRDYWRRIFGPSKMELAFERERQILDAARIAVEHEMAMRISEAKTALAKAEASRDYFRQRAERLELVIEGRVNPQPGPRQPKRTIEMPVSRRKHFGQLVKERLEENARKDREEAERKKAEAGLTTEGINGATPVSESRNAEASRPDTRQ